MKNKDVISICCGERTIGIHRSLNTDVDLL